MYKKAAQVAILAQLAGTVENLSDNRVPLGDIVEVLQATTTLLAEAWFDGDLAEIKEWSDAVAEQDLNVSFWIDVKETLERCNG